MRRNTTVFRRPGSAEPGTQQEELAESLDELPPAPTAYLSEGAFQRTLFANPEVLRSCLAGPSNAPLFPLAMEFDLIDALFLDANGLLTLLETKRATDGRAKRDVFAQVMEYAASLSASYSTIEEFTESLLEYTAGHPKGKLCSTEIARLENDADRALNLYRLVGAQHQACGEKWGYPSDARDSGFQQFKKNFEANLRSRCVRLIVAVDGEVHPLLMQTVEFAIGATNTPLQFVLVEATSIDAAENGNLLVVTPRWINYRTFPVVQATTPHSAAEMVALSEERAERLNVRTLYDRMKAFFNEHWSGPRFVQRPNTMSHSYYHKDVGSQGGVSTRAYFNIWLGEDKDRQIALVLYHWVVKISPEALTEFRGALGELYKDVEANYGQVDVTEQNWPLVKENLVRLTRAMKRSWSTLNSDQPV